MNTQPNRKRSAQFRQVSHENECRDLVHGSAIVKGAEVEGVEGWTLPGRIFTASRFEAYRVCKKMHKLIASNKRALAA